MLKASLLATASVFLIGTASAQNNCNANPDQPFCQGGGEYDDTELRDRILTNEINIAELDVELMRQIDILQVENSYIWDDITYLAQRDGELQREIERVEEDSFMRDQFIEQMVIGAVIVPCSTYTPTTF